MDPLLVILDLDETLVYATEAELDRAPDFRAAHYAVYKRPHVEQFLAGLFETCRVAIWTSSGRVYATEVVTHLLGSPSRLQFFWCAERCTDRFDHETRGRYTVKKLHKVRKRGYELARVVVVDDSPEKHALNYGNLIAVAPFEGDASDAELPRLLRYIRALEEEPNVRAVEKRTWRLRG